MPAAVGMLWMPPQAGQGGSAATTAPASARDDPGGSRPHTMFALAADAFNRPSETFVRAHLQDVAPDRTVLLCRDGRGAEAFGRPVLSELSPYPAPRHPGERLAAALRHRWRRYVDPALCGPDERRVRAFLQLHGATALMAEYGQNGLLLRRACVRAGVPLFVHFHGHDATLLGRLPEFRRHYRRLFRDAAGIIAPSRFLADRLHAIGCPLQKLHVSPNGIDPKLFRPTTREPGRVLAVGRLLAVKGPLQTLQAFANVLREVPDAHLDVVGDGPLRAACEDLRDRLGMTGSVTFHGARPHDVVVDLMGRAALFVQHSVTAPDGQAESFGISLIEANASEVPVVSTRSGGIPDTVAEGETALLVEENDVEGMAAAMLSLLRDPERAAAMGRAGRARVEAGFSRATVGARLRAIMGLEA